MLPTLNELGVVDSFNIVLNMPIPTSAENVKPILDKYKISEKEKELIAEMGKGIPVKYLLLTLEMAV